MSKHDITVLGCGPAGLLATHAAVQQGLSVEIISLEQMSPMNGAQYLHRAIPGATDPAEAFRVNYIKEGKARQYALNVYGDENAPVSWAKFAEGPQLAYPLHETYNRLWEMYHELIVNAEIQARDVPQFVREARRVISTIPRKVLCQNPEHNFEAQKVYIAPVFGTPHRPQGHGMRNVIIYNGTTRKPWYRTSSINGHDHTESRYPIFGGVEGYKPLRTNCDCHVAAGVQFLGRFGKWDKQILLHHVYDEAKEIATGIRWSRDIEDTMFEEDTGHALH